MSWWGSKKTPAAETEAQADAKPESEASTSETAKEGDGDEETNPEAENKPPDGEQAAIEKVRKEKLAQLKQLEDDLEQEQLNQMKEALIHKIEVERIKRQSAHAEERLKALEHDMEDKAAIHEYANLIKGVAPKEGADGQYVMKLQSQLHKAVKKMETTTENMKELEVNSREVVDTLTKEISELIEDRCRAELDLRKQMEVLKEQKRDMQVEYEKRIQENYKTLQALREKATNQATIEELDKELEETERKMAELHRIKETQTKTIDQLNKSLAASKEMS